MSEVQDAYQAYVEQRRARGPEPEPMAQIALTGLELAIISMTLVSEKNTIVFPAGTATADEARAAASSLLRKLDAAHLSHED